MNKNFVSVQAAAQYAISFCGFDMTKNKTCFIWLTFKEILYGYMTPERRETATKVQGLTGTSYEKVIPLRKRKYIVHAHTQKHCQCKLLQSGQKRKQQFRHLLLIKIEAFQSIAAPQSAHPLLSLASFFFSLCYTLILKKLTLPVVWAESKEDWAIRQTAWSDLKQKREGNMPGVRLLFPRGLCSPFFSLLTHIVTTETLVRRNGSRSQSINNEARRENRGFD